MKKIMVFAVVLLTLRMTAFAAGDSTALDTTKAVLDSVRSISTVVHETRDSIKAGLSRSSTCPCIQKNEPVSGKSLGLVYAPVLLFLILFGVFVFVLRGFNFIDALSENDVPKYTIVNPEYSLDAQKGNVRGIVYDIMQSSHNSSTSITDIVPPTVEVNVLPGQTPSNNFRPSTSRYIAFFSGMLTVILSVCMTSFFIYQYLHTGCPPDLSALSTVLIALGIGVTPYMVNKISTAVANRKTED